METGTEPNSPQSIDALHDQIIAETPIGADAAPNVETGGNPIAGPNGNPGVDTGFCKEVIANCCDWHADAVRAEFISALEPICGMDQATRIADRAAMAPPVKEAIATHGSNVLNKYGVGKFVNDEVVLIGAIAMYWRGLSMARKDRDKILKAHAAAQNPAQA